VRIHFKNSSPAGQYGSADTYVSNHTARGGVMTNEIWDGTDSTAPEWIKLGSREAMHAMRMGENGKDIELGNFMGGGHALRASVEGGYIYKPPRAYPSFVLQPGRGIIQNAPGITPPGETPCWMSMPDPPFLCENEKEKDKEDSEPNFPKRIPNPSKSKVRWEIEEIDERGQAKGTKEDDGAVLESRDRREAGYRLDRIVETLTEPATAASKRWSQGSFGDRTNHRRQKNNEEDKTALSKETFFDS
jgi:hypothetical protein